MPFVTTSDRMTIKKSGNPVGIINLGTTLPSGTPFAELTAICNTIRPTFFDASFSGAPFTNFRMNIDGSGYVGHVDGKLFCNNVLESLIPYTAGNEPVGTVYTFGSIVYGQKLFAVVWYEKSGSEYIYGLIYYNMGTSTLVWTPLPAFTYHEIPFHQSFKLIGNLGYFFLHEVSGGKVISNIYQLNCDTNTASVVAALSSTDATEDDVFITSLSVSNDFMTVSGIRRDSAGTSKTNFVYTKKIADLTSTDISLAASYDVFNASGGSAPYPAEVFQVSNNTAQILWYFSTSATGLIYNSETSGTARHILSEAQTFSLLDPAVQLGMFDNGIPYQLDGETTISFDILHGASAYSGDYFERKNFVRSGTVILGSGSKGFIDLPVPETGSILAANDFVVGIKATYTLIGTANDFNLFYTEDLSGTDQLVVMYDYSANTFVVSGIDSGGTLRTLCTFDVSAYFNLNSLLEIVVSRINGTWSCTIDGSSCTATPNATYGGMAISSGEVVVIEATTVIQHTVHEISFEVDGNVLITGIPGWKMAVGNSNVTTGRTFGTFLRTYSLSDQQFDFDLPTNKTARGFIRNTLSLDEIDTWFYGNDITTDDSVICVMKKKTGSTAQSITLSSFDGGTTGGAAIASIAYDPINKHMITTNQIPDYSPVTYNILCLSKISATEYDFSPQEKTFFVEFIPPSSTSQAYVEAISFQDTDSGSPVFSIDCFAVVVGSVTASSSPYAIAKFGEGYKDFFKKSGSGIRSIDTFVFAEKSYSGTRYEYVPAAATFVIVSGGRYKLQAATYSYQNSADDFSAYLETANKDLLYSVDETERTNIVMFIKATISRMVGVVSWTLDTNYRFNTEEEILPFGEDAETSRIEESSEGTYEIYNSGSRQIVVKSTPIDMRNAYSIKVKIQAANVDIDGNARYDDFKVFHVAVLPESAFAIGGENA